MVLMLKDMYRAPGHDWNVLFYTPFVVEEQNEPYANFVSISAVAKEITFGVVEQAHPVPKKGIDLLMAIDRFERQMSLLDDLDKKCDIPSADAFNSDLVPLCSYNADMCFRNPFEGMKIISASEASTPIGLPTYLPRRLSDDRISETEESQLPHEDRVIRPPHSRKASDSSVASNNLVSSNAPRTAPRYGINICGPFNINEEPSKPPPCCNMEAIAAKVSTIDKAGYAKYLDKTRDFYQKSYFSDDDSNGSDNDEADKENRVPTPLFNYQGSYQFGAALRNKTARSRNRRQ